MKRAELFVEALTGCQRLLTQFPGHPPLLSVIAQIEYLIALESGARNDRGRLRDINLGLVTARELEVLDPQLADLLHEVSSEAELMGRRASPTPHRR